MRERRPSVAEEILLDGVFSGIFAGWGESRVVALNYEPVQQVEVVADTTVATSGKSHEGNHAGKHAKLNTLLSVSIAGCDLMGSALYTAGTCFSNAGKFAPVGLFLVTCMLFLYRKVYSEVVTAFPVNGGSYNLMLNTTSKKVAGFVACLSILSYIATAIISAFDAVIYTSDVWEDMDVRLWSVLILIFFAAVTICGVKESSTVSCTMFSIHVFTLTLLIIWGFAYGIQDNFHIFHENTKSELPTITTSTGALLARHNIVAAIYFGYSSGLLGITGFETASNYVEDLESSQTFVKTVNWMWFLSGVYNPLIALVSMMVIPMDRILAHPSDMLAEVALELGGPDFKTYVSIDAGFVLCGGVLTSLVGVSGLLSRLAKDRVLPEFFAYVNSRGTNYIGISVFAILSITLFLAIFDPADPKGIHDFGGVFAISFLSVLTAFACGAILLKLYRPRIARLVIAKWWHIIVSGLAVFAGLIGNIILTPDIFYLFLGYLGIFLLLVAYMFSRVEIFSFAIWIIRRIYMNEELRKNEFDMNQEILAACKKQDHYDEDNQITKMITNYKDLRAAVRRSITLRNEETSIKEEENQKRQSTEGFPELDTIANTSSKAIIAPTNRSVFRIASIPTFLRRSLIIKSGREEGENEIDLEKNQTNSYIPLRYFDRNSAKSADEIDLILSKPLIGSTLSYCMESLDHLLTVPFVYLAKHSDPISLQLALNYIDQNELTNIIYILHFVDDRKAITANHEYEQTLVYHQQHQTDESMTREIDQQKQVNESGTETINNNQHNKKNHHHHHPDNFQIPKHGFLLNLFMKPVKKEQIVMNTFTSLKSHYMENTQQQIQMKLNDQEEVVASDGSVVEMVATEHGEKFQLPMNSNTKHETGEDERINNEERNSDRDSNATVEVENQFSLDAAFPFLPYESQQLLHNVAILDAFYTYKKIHAIVVRGGFFSPSSLHCVANYLGVSKNSMIMGVPDTNFPFPFARLNGCRIAIPDADPDVRRNASVHLRTVLETVERQTKLYQEHIVDQRLKRRNRNISQ